jgi:very-short-patch-repair endonuclease
MAATLAVGPRAVLSHRSAAQLWGLAPRKAIAPEVTIPRGWRGQAGICVRRSGLPADEVTQAEKIPVTTVPRTLLDLAAVVSKRQLELALNEAEVQRLTDALSVPDLLERYPRRPGSAVLRSLLRDEAALNGITQNDFEEDFVALLDAHSLQRPRFNADVVVRGRHFNVDCLWREGRLIVELDGREVHGTARAFETDRERDRLLLADGWRVMRLTWRQVRDDPAEIVADLRLLLEGSPARPRSGAPTL